ncbi:MAG TPA: type II toxin-antitoxin system VapC family toxin [Candidatus Acidoferrum sp.]
MKLLLDTHIWIWSDVEAHKLSSEVMRELASPENERYLSAVSVWEAILLLEKKRTRLKGDFGEWFKKSKLELGLIEVPLTWEIAQEIRYTILGYRDPGDRFLVATAKVHDLTLVTADERLMQIPGLKVLANR